MEGKGPGLDLDVSLTNRRRSFGLSVDWTSRLDSRVCCHGYFQPLVGFEKHVKTLLKSANAVF